MFVLRDGELEAEVVDRRHVLPRKVLKNSGEERLGEVETRDPEDRRSPAEDPLLDTSNQNLYSKSCVTIQNSMIGSNVSPQFVGQPEIRLL